MFSTKKSLALLINATLLSTFSATVTAEQAQLDQMVVTATRTPTAVSQIAGSVSVISQTDIEAHQYQTLADALKTVPGLTVVELGGRGSQTSVFARGTNSNHTLVLVDGIEINDTSSPTGAFDFSNFLLDDIASIEIVRGSQSVLYGADAIGAVIQIHTKKGSGKLKAKAKLAAGNKSTSHETVNVSGEKGQFNYSVSGGLFESDGDSISPKHRLPANTAQDDDGYRNKLFSARLGWTPSQNLEANLFARHIESETEIDGFLNEDFDAYNTSRQTYLGAELKGAFFSGFWQPKLSLTHTDIQRNNHNARISTLDDADRSRYIGEKSKLSLQNDFHLAHNNLLTVGYEFEDERLDSKGTSIYGSMFGDYIINQQSDASRQNRAVYIQDQLAINDKLNATLGLRNDNTDDFDSETTYKLSLNYLATEDSRVWLSHGTGFRAPSLYELYGYSPSNYLTAYYGNPNLDAETSKNWEIGLDQIWLNGQLQTNLTLFKNKIDDLITTYYFPSFDSTSINQDEADIHGLESDITLHVNDKVDFHVSYTFTRTQDDDDRELLRRPKHQASFDVEYKPTTALSLITTLQHTGSRKDVDDAGQRIRTGGYSVVNMTANYTVNPTFKVFGRVNNLFDKEYAPAFGYQATGILGMVGVELSTH